MTVDLLVDGAVATVTLNRPERLNAINAAMREDFRRAFAQIERDRSVKVVLLTGAGDRAFCSGADLNEVGTRTGLERRLLAPSDPANVARACTKPVIAVIHGYAFGGGLELAISCDIRVAAADAVLSFPEIGHGWLPAGGGGTQVLPRLVGMGQAMIAVLSGRRYSGEQAQQMGLVDVVVQPDELLAEARRLANEIAQHRLDAIVLGKAALRMSERMDLHSGLEYEREIGALTYGFDNRDEAVNAFKEKREPKFND